MTRKPTILLADDYPDAREVWELYLAMNGFQVLLAANGRQALARATEELPDLVVLDLDMPGLSGIEVARVLRSQPATNRIPLVAATGLSQGRVLDEARAAGFDVVLGKPCDPDLLISEIRQLLSR